MEKTGIRYFGSDVVYGEACEPLSPDSLVIATMKQGGRVTTAAGDLDLMGMNRDNYPVSYTP
ncbi:hypothetical protein ABI_08460 [Asticcacaulis biprosthecium C19]|uniref:Uncharacterized protein n=1 Tax=Asticcacaulis biprosthecium C19 TaxID=715226 RepID=F4QG82_9CAUL|nr:hypothetical protein [Asticcacaulis biprosthecium]EGF92410.1 hypothetical protein ABI_08460 [Asticcacaulis biprosthecium C19]